MIMLAATLLFVDDEVRVIYAVAAIFAVAALIAMWAVTRFTKPPAGRLLSEPSESELPTYYTTPPRPERCRNLVKDGPTPCWHPHCDCMTTDYAEPRPRLGSDEVLRRHLISTRKDSKRVSPRTKA